MTTPPDPQTKADVELAREALLALYTVLLGRRARPATLLAIAAVVLRNYRRARRCTTQQAIDALVYALDAAV